MDIVIATKNVRREKEIQMEEPQMIFVRDNMRSMKKLLQLNQSKAVLVKEKTFIKEKTAKFVNQVEN